MGEERQEEMEKFDPSNHPHRRFNPLTRKWVLCSPHRANRPWQGAKEKTIKGKSSRSDGNNATESTASTTGVSKSNYLMPGATRSNGKVNDMYTKTWSFQNDFDALKSNSEICTVGEVGKDLFVTESVIGECHVICFNPDTNLTIAQMSTSQIQDVIAAWRQKYKELSAKKDINHVQIFENKGAAMGCSNPHPHGQVWASNFIPSLTSEYLESMKMYAKKHKSNLLQDYAKLEQEKNERVVVENDTFICVVPYWAAYPFETMIIPKSSYRFNSLLDLNQAQIQDLADIIRRLTCKYDNLFECQFPYSMGINQIPTDDKEDYNYTQLHLIYFPPLLRSATVRKFMVGFEMLGEPQRDLTPELACLKLKDLPEIHYCNEPSK